MVKKRTQKRVVMPETSPRSITEALEEHFALCRKYGVLHWDGPAVGVGPVKFDLAPQLATDPEIVAPSSSREAVPVPSAPKSEPAVGADGLSADMQEELLGRVMDAKR